MTQADPAQTFRIEAIDLLEILQSCLLELDQKPDDLELVNAAFRALHTLKGSGAMFGFDAISTFVHEFETAFDAVRKGKAPITSELIALSLAAIDHIQNLIDRPAADVEGGDSILADLRAAIAGSRPAQAVVDSGVMAEAVDAGAEVGWRVLFSLPPDIMVHGTNPALLIEEILALGKGHVAAMIAGVPELGTLDPEQCYLGWRIDVQTGAGRQAIEDAFMFFDMQGRLSITPTRASQARSGEPSPSEPVNVPLPGPVTAVPAIAEKPAASGRAAAISAEAEPAQPPAVRATRPDAAHASLRVPAERLDSLMDCVGELVIAQARLSQLAAMSGSTDLKSVAEDMERLSATLRDTTMGIRMVPIGTLFGRFRRLVHDLGRELGKQIEFQTSGEETELDKTVIEHLADPLVHLIRNAVDHGLETPPNRLEAGKPAGGTVRLQATYAGAEVAIAISDDGAGLDAARIRAKAIEAGLIAPDAEPGEAELFQLIFHPGFSTAREITTLSGRGVGMDVVKRTIEGLRGSIDLTSERGKGTTATLRLPLTLAIIDGLLVRVGQGRYTIPLAAVEECVELPADADTQAKGRSFLNIRGSLVPFLRLREIFGTMEAEDPYPKVVVIASGENRVGLVVDQIIGNNQTVIKQLSPLHAGLRAFSGATILGDGSVALILDVMNLVGLGQERLDRQDLRPLGRAA